MDNYLTYAVRVLAGRLPPGQHHMKCPACGRNRAADQSLSVKVESDGTGKFLCHRCKEKGSWHPDRLSVRQDRAPLKLAQPAPEVFETLSDFAQQLWHETVRLPGTAGERYLKSRGCVIPPENGDLRFHPRLRHPITGYVGPALIALVSHAVTGAPLTLHRTWVSADGSKPDEARPSRMLLGRHTKKHGVIRLWPDSAVLDRLGICEGIESALSLAHAWEPVWSALDAGNVASFPVLNRIKHLLIGADNDPAGIAASRECADRWSRAGAHVRIAMPSERGQDMNDLVREVRV